MGSVFAVLGIACISSLLGVWVGYRFTISHTDEVDRRVAGSKLRESFKDEIIALNPAHTIIKDDLPAFLWNAFPKHEAAIYDFSFILKPKRKAAFYKTWEEYYCHKDAQNENTVPFLEQYSCRGLTIQQKHDVMTLVKSRLEAILEFTT